MRIGNYIEPERSMTARERENHAILQKFFSLELTRKSSTSPQCLVFDDYDEMRKIYKMIYKKCRNKGWGVRPKCRVVDKSTGAVFCIWKIKNKK